MEEGRLLLVSSYNYLAMNMKLDANGFISDFVCYSVVNESALLFQCSIVRDMQKNLTALNSYLVVNCIGY
jgi:hypothetical protein